MTARAIRSERPLLKGRAVTALFVAAILAGSFLLFLVQPMVARMALPRLGGAPAVWNSAMLVYQALLLGGYAYAHALARLPVRQQAVLHLAVLALAAFWLPIGLIAARMPAGGEPAVWVPWLLAASIGPLFFAISAQAPLLQRWFNAASGGRDPYALYAASNIGSFGGLLAYPLLVEPALALHQQSLLWTAGYGIVFALIAWTALLLPRGATVAARERPASPAPDRRRIAHWIALATVPSGLMLATSTFLTTDIVAVPLLWVMPLGLYLLSFTVAFASNRTLANLLVKFAPLTILMFGGVIMSGHQEYPYLNALIALILLFVVAVALHTRMYDLRPDPDRLTGFYLAMSVGGALGGVFAALIAPVLFDWTWEYPILVLAAGALASQSYLLPVVARIWNRHGQGLRIATLALALITAVLVLVGIGNPGWMLGENAEGIAFFALAAVGFFTIGARVPFLIVLAGTLFVFGGYRSLMLSLEGDARTRSYFGVYTVREEPGERTLAHGTTLHGIQETGSPERERQPTTYYIPNSGVGQAMQSLDLLYGPHARVGVVGLGAGTLACYAKPGQDWRFYEIDPAVVWIARDSGRFTFLRNCLPNPRIILGDARLSLAEEQTDSLDLLVLDAFSSDSVPMHMMTVEAFRTYDRVLAPGGLLLVHISNRFLELEPVVYAAGRAGKWSAAKLNYTPEPGEGPAATSSEWIALSRDPSTIGKLVARDGYWEPVKRYRGFTAWTDDYASILPLLRALNPETQDE